MNGAGSRLSESEAFQCFVLIVSGWFLMEKMCFVCGMIKEITDRPQSL